MGAQEIGNIPGNMEKPVARYNAVVFGGAHDGRRVRIPVDSIGVYLLPGRKGAPDPYYGMHNILLPMQRAAGAGHASVITRILAAPFGDFSNRPSIELLDLLFAARFWLQLGDVLEFHDQALAPGSLTRVLNFARQISRPVLTVVPSASWKK